MAFLAAHSADLKEASTGRVASPVELWHRRIFVFSLTATLGLGAQIGYAKVVPRIPQLYAALIRAAVWDTVFVGVLVAQFADISSQPVLAGTDLGHYLPMAVLIYHAMTMVFCAVSDLISRSGEGRARTWHRSLVCRRVLLELAGGASGSKLYLGRVCFVVSSSTLWLALRILAWMDEGTTVLTCFIILLLVAYCGAGLAALEPRHSLPGNLVQWLCTGWGTREALCQGPLKVLGGLFLLPFAASVITAQIWLRTVAFLVWLAMACPCCRLQQGDNVYDAFERELALPLLQCSFLAFSCTLSALVLGFGQLTPNQRWVVGVTAAYYTSMLMAWTAPAVLQAKVALEEAHDSSNVLSEESTASQPLRGELSGEGMEIELEDLRGSFDELRALLHRERHDHSVEVGQLQNRLRDHEVQVRTAEREKGQVEEELKRLGQELEQWRERCAELKKQIALGTEKPALPRLQWPLGQNCLHDTGSDSDRRSETGSQPLQLPGVPPPPAGGTASEAVSATSSCNASDDESADEGPSPASAAEDLRQSQTELSKLHADSELSESEPLMVGETGAETALDPSSEEQELPAGYAQVDAEAPPTPTASESKGPE